MGGNIAPTYLNLWSGIPPSHVGSADTLPVCLALRGQTTVPGLILGARFFRDLADGNPHLALMWTDAHLELQDAAPFHIKAASGAGPDSWQSAYFKRNHRLAAGDKFVIGVWFQGGMYSYQSGALVAGPVVNGPLLVQQDVGGSNGLFSYGSIIPVSSFGSTMYGVDVIFKAD